MPTLHRFVSCKLEIRYRDHLPPHVHVLMADRREALIELASLKIIGDIPARELGDVLSWIENNRDMLLETWNRYHP